MEVNEVSGKVIGAAIEVHRTLRPGLLESVYQACLAHEFDLQGIRFVKEKPVPVRYKRIELDCGYRIDFLIENLIVVELKAVKALEPVHEAQLMTYLRLTGCKIGLLINFNVPVLKNGIKRMVR